MKKLILILFITCALLSNAFADVPRIISYQGVLTDANGKPIPNENNKKITFLFYNTESGGSAITSKEMTVDVIGGLFSTLIELPIFDMNQQLFMGIAPEGMSEFPRIQLASAAHALSIADNCVTSSKIKDGEVKASDIANNAVSVEKLAPGNTLGQTLVWNGSSWTMQVPTVQATVPIGTIQAFAGEWSGNTKTKLEAEGWRLCNGLAIDRAMYKDLFDAIKIYWGSGDGVSTFNLPDLRGLFLRGVDNGRGYDFGRTLGSFQDDEFENHEHDIQVNRWGGSGLGEGHELTKNPKHKSQNDKTDSQGGDETRPKNMAVNYIIKVK